MHLLTLLFITLVPLPLAHSTTLLLLQLRGQTTSLSTGSLTHDFNQTSLVLSSVTCPITTCGCTSLEDKKKYLCAYIVRRKPRLLEYDNKLVPDPVTAGAFIPPVHNAAESNPRMVHFDLKPANIFGLDRTGPLGTHPHTQIWKIGDFGLAWQLEKTGFNMPLPGG